MNSGNRAWHRAKGFAFTLTLFALFGSAAFADGPQVAQIKTVSGQAEIVRNGAAPPPGSVILFSRRTRSKLVRTARSESPSSTIP